MLKRLILIGSIAAGQAAANCTPPYVPVFACNILTADQRVEICASQPDEDGVSNTYTYNFASGMAISELYFETEDNRFSTKYYRLGNRPENTTGIGLVHENHVYAAYITGVDGGEVRAAQIHVYDSLPSFESTERETETLRLYCETGTVRVNWDFIRP